ncbi:hypothetical protein BO78DRAFT_85837 [Aspergillus sclerotiicarbonarius CBS 121057]|uniref:Uncharacterized protein n=1 Tax=Aspergillus sclerotiicarbonarius (strain CBS 121057 / IBT 28362) TaxID=1448318 RepID=A0A319EE47_ASPSB|nr:hypothetical protein BO78DRAFT_85837 [Aspergillus sclerotiicarbonarius CBS 121057]
MQLSPDYEIQILSLPVYSSSLETSTRFRQSGWMAARHLDRGSLSSYNCYSSHPIPCHEYPQTAILQPSIAYYFFFFFLFFFYRLPLPKASAWPAKSPSSLAPTLASASKPAISSSRPWPALSHQTQQTRFPPQWQS